jgi:hypothetical protein
MAPNSPINPNKKPGPTMTGDLIEELLFKIKQEEKDNPQAPPPQVSKAPPQIKVNKNSLLPNRKVNNGNCCNCCDDMLGMLNFISNSANNILDALKAEHLLDKKKVEEVRKSQEESERRERENLLESSGRKMSRAFSAVFAPIKNVLDTILKFILFTLLGKALTNILKWFADPANKNKVKSLTRFLKDWWPAILGAFVLFGTKFGLAIRSTVRAITSTVLFLKKLGIPGLLAQAKKFGKAGLIAGAVAGAGVLAYELLKPKTNEKVKSGETIPAPQSRSTPLTVPGLFNGGLVKGINFMLPEEKHISQIGFAEGGHIDDDTGMRITGAGPDTQLIAAQPGEIVISKAAVDKYGADTFLRMNKMAGSTNQPKFVNNIQLAKEGGMVGGMKNLPGEMFSGLKSGGMNIINGLKSIGMPKLNRPAKASKPSGLPKISPADYNALLAISSAEDSDPQGRADVAQSIYNRLYASSNYKMNFLQNEGKSTIKDIITGSNQYEPTFKNRGDWLNIVDRNSAAKALANSKKIDISTANNWLNETEKALKNSQLQANAQRHVEGRPSFFGMSQKKFMKNDDVLRKDRQDNFFTHYPAEKSQYRIERGNIAAPIPEQFYMPTGNEQSSVQTKGLQLARNSPTLAPPKPRVKPNAVSITELPAINLKAATPMRGSAAHSEVPEFSAIPDYTDRYGENGTLAVRGIVA